MTSTSTTIIKNLLLLFLVIAGLVYAKDFLMPLAIASILATLFLPFCKWLENKKIPTGLAVFICLFILLAFISGIITMVGWQVAELTNDIELVKQRIVETSDRITLYLFQHFGISADEQATFLKTQQNTVAAIVQSIAGSMASIFTNMLLILVYFFLLLFYRVHLKNFILKLTPLAKQDEMSQVIFRSTKISQQYLIGLAKMIVCLWFMYGIGFSIIGVENAIFFAILCGLLEIVPFVGNITGTTITILIASVHGAGFPMIGGILLTYGTVQFIQGWVLEPLILGPQVKINPLFTIIALILGELIWGIPGVILAIPLTAIAKIICDHVESLKPYGFLIGEIESQKKESPFIKKIKEQIR